MGLGEFKIIHKIALGALGETAPEVGSEVERLSEASRRGGQGHPLFSVIGRALGVSGRA